MIDPEVRVLLERAERWRAELDSLLGVIPRDHWVRAAPGDPWPARTHLAHLATIDAPVTELFEAATSGAHELLPFGAATMDDLRGARAALLDTATERADGELLACLAPARRRAMEALSRLSARHLDLPVRFPAAGAWSRPASVTLREYAAAWATHDGEHAAAIRAAIATAPSPAAMAAAASLRRR